VNVLDSFKLDGQVALVTGGAGLYGSFIVDALAESGATVYTAGRSLPKYQEQAHRCQSRGMSVIAAQYDQSSTESMEKLLAQIIAEQGKLDILVNNAVLRSMKSWDDLEGLKVSMEANATGVIAMINIFGRQMMEQKSGSIINIASMQGMVGPDFALYQGTAMDVPPDYFFHKAGLINVTRYYAARFAPFGIRVNAISPGGIQAGQDQLFQERYSQRTFLGRLAEGEEIKGAVVFLASKASSYLTGVNLPVDGGYTAH
jgi:NAD(P)-dependent dehydrogenase (short-subunit alcohol dehydrogenase family)